MRRQQRHTIAAHEAGYTFTDRIHSPPRLMSGRAGLEWILKPWLSFPDRKIGSANTAAFDLNAQFIRSRLAKLEHLQLDSTWRGHDGCVSQHRRRQQRGHD